MLQSFCRKCKSHFHQSCAKEFIWFLCECIVILLRGACGGWRTCFSKKSKERLMALSKRNKPETETENLSSEGNSQLEKVEYSPVISPLSCHEQVLSCSGYCVQQNLDCASEQEFHNSLGSTQSFTEIDSLSWGRRKLIIAQIDALVDKNISNNHTNPSNSQLLVLTGVKTASLVSFNAIQVHHKHADIPDN